MQTMDEYVRASMAPPRLNASLIGALALLALGLGAVGVGGVVAQIVSARRSELAIRLALGGARSRIVRDVAASGIRLCLVGLGVGLAAALAVGRAASSLQYEARPSDPGTLAVVGAVLLIVAAIACLVPARGVTRIDPAVALRGQ
jgi:putative ABC transport system permease protein